MVKKKLITLMLCGCLITGCGSVVQTEKPENDSEIESNETQTEMQETEQVVIDIPDSLDFVDAFGEMHTLKVHKDWKLKSFEKNSFIKAGEKMSYESEAFPFGYRLGVDVSRYDGNIDWKAVKQDGYDFAFIRIGFRGYGKSGVLKKDETAIRNIKGAFDAGLEVGVYFFSQAVSEEEAVEEAEFTLSILEKAGLSEKEITLPIVFDPESILNDEARTDDVSGEQFTLNAVAFFDTIEKAGYKGMIYSNLIWESEMLDLNVLKSYPVWYADYELQPQTPYDFDFWQYTESGKVKGISTEVDINIQVIR